MGKDNQENFRPPTAEENLASAVSALRRLGWTDAEILALRRPRPGEPTAGRQDDRAPLSSKEEPAE